MSLIHVLHVKIISGVQGQRKPSARPLALRRTNENIHEGTGDICGYLCVDLDTRNCNLFYGGSRMNMHHNEAISELVKETYIKASDT